MFKFKVGERVKIKNQEIAGTITYRRVGCISMKNLYGVKLTSNINNSYTFYLIGNTESFYEEKLVLMSPKTMWELYQELKQPYKRV